MTASILPLGPETVTADPFNAQTPLAALAESVTPVGAFFVRDHFGIPRLEPDRWRLSVGGAVAAPYQLAYGELRMLAHRELDVVVECAGNGRTLMTPRPPGLPWGERAVGCARFGGVAFRDVAARAHVKPGVVEFVFVGADSGEAHGRRVPFERALPLDLALHPDTLLATHMNGEPLPSEHGAPVRLVVPGRYGVDDVKWLIGARAVTQPFNGVFQTDDYVYLDSHGTPDGPVTTVRVKTLITAPAQGDVLERDSVVGVRGWAWSGGAPVGRVELRLDTADWIAATLEPPTGRHAWTGWHLLWSAKRPGVHRLLARATDANGDTQPLEPSWNAKGYGCNAASGVEVIVR